MLISCPKCHSVYEVPDDLIPKSGQNFRCAACSNVWNVIKSDALGYSKEDDEEIMVEAIKVEEPPYRNYPADKDEFKIVNDAKVKKKVLSSKEVVEKEGDASYVMPKVKNRAENELTLTSSEGTSFTISMGKGEDVEKSMFSKYNEKEEIKADINNRLMVEKKKNWYVKTRLCIYFLFLVLIGGVFRDFIVWGYNGAENFYNKIGLSGYDNQRNLEFLDVKVDEVESKGKKFVKIVGEIKNNGLFDTKVKDVEVVGYNKYFSPKNKFLKAKEVTEVVILLPIEDNMAKSYKIQFIK